jgi:3',5'-cyclic-AMP phosphodiesterase
VTLELTTVTDDSAVMFEGADVRCLDGLKPGHPYRFGDQEFVTLCRPAGERLATVATVNDVHFGEVRAGYVEGHDVGPGMSAAPGEDPYPQVMNAAAVAEIAALHADLVVAKGDLTTQGLIEEYQQFEACYRTVLGGRLCFTLGNHDKPSRGAVVDCPPTQEFQVPGALVAILDTARVGRGGGSLDTEQLDWLDELASRADVPVLVFGHHPAWEDGVDDWLDEASAIDPAPSAQLVEVFARRPALIGYFAGHTHRNRVRHFPSTGAVPFAEVACTKDFPGSWAEYRIFEGGVLQIHHRITAPAALQWSERCRALFFGLYPKYAFGTMSDRCFPVALRNP